MGRVKGVHWDPFRPVERELPSGVTWLSELHRNRHEEEAVDSPYRIAPREAGVDGPTDLLQHRPWPREPIGSRRMGKSVNLASKADSDVIDNLTITIDSEGLKTRQNHFRFAEND